MSTIRERIDFELTQVHLDKTRLFEIISQLVDMCEASGSGGAGLPGPAGPPGPPYATSPAAASRRVPPPPPKSPPPSPPRRRLLRNPMNKFRNNSK